MMNRIPLHQKDNFVISKTEPDPTSPSKMNGAASAGGSFEVLINLKVFEHGTTKQLWEGYCLLQTRGTIGTLCKEAQKQFLPSEYKKGVLEQRNVTIFSTRFNLEVSVALDNSAVDGARYTVNLLYSAQTSAQQAESSSSAKQPLKPESNSPTSSDIEVRKKEFDRLAKQYSEVKTSLANKMELLTQIENELVVVNKQKDGTLDDLAKVEKSVKSQLEVLKQTEKDLNGQKEEKKKLNDQVKILRDKLARKTKELDTINKDLDKLTRKQKGMLQQMEVYKKELNDEMDGLNNLIKKKEIILEECEKLQKSLEDMRNDELLCKGRLEQLQEEEKNFHTMLEELKEQAMVSIQMQKQQQLQQREVNIQSELVVENALNPTCDSLQLDSSPIRRTITANGKAFTVPCVYFQQGDCWRGNSCTFIHDESTQRKRKVNEDENSDSKRDRRHSEQESERQSIAERDTNETEKSPENASDQSQNAPVFGRSSFGSSFGQNQVKGEKAFKLGGGTNFNAGQRELPVLSGNSRQFVEIGKEWRQSTLQNMQGVSLFDGGEFWDQGQYIQQNPSMQSQFFFQNATQKSYSDYYRPKKGQAKFKHNHGVAGRRIVMVVDQQQKGNKRKTANRPRSRIAYADLSPRSNEFGTMPSTSSAGGYGRDRPRSNDSSSILDRISIEQQPSSKSSSKIQSRVSFEKK